MSRHSPNSQLAALLAEAGWSAAELARNVNALGAAQGQTLRYDRTSVAHWLAGSRPRNPVPALVAQSLSRGTGRLVEEEDTGLARPVPRVPRLADLETTDPATALVTLCRTDADPGRRGLLLRSPYVMTGKTLPLRPGIAANTGTSVLSAHTAQRTTPATVRTLDDVSHLFVALFGAHGGGQARTALATYVADDVAALLAGPTTLNCRRGLLGAAARLAHTLGIMTVDAGYHGLAQRYYLTAVALAQEAEERGTVAISLRALSTQAQRLGQVQAAHRLVQAAIAAVGNGADPAVRSFLHAQRALTHALAQRPKAALADLATAEKAHDQSSGPPGPFTTYPRAGLDYVKAEVFLALREWDLALVALRDAVRHRSASQHKSYALTHARLAETLLRVGHLEAACVHWHHFLDHYPYVKSAQARRALGHLAEGISPHRARRPAASLWQRAAEHLSATTRS